MQADFLPLSHLENEFRFMVIPVNIVHFIISVFIWEGEMIKSISYIWGFNLSF